MPPTLVFHPLEKKVEADSQTKILVAAVRNKIPIRFGCAACQCGTCAVKIAGSGELSQMENDEMNLLQRMKLPVDGSVRLSCRAKLVNGTIEVDLDFQKTYSPDQGDQEEVP